MRPIQAASARDYVRARPHRPAPCDERRLSAAESRCRRMSDDWSRTPRRRDPGRRKRWTIVTSCLFRCSCKATWSRPDAGLAARALHADRLDGVWALAQHPLGNGNRRRSRPRPAGRAGRHAGVRALRAVAATLAPVARTLGAAAHRHRRWWYRSRAARVLAHDGRRSAVRAGPEASHRLRDADLHGRAVRTVDRGRRDAAAAGCLRARPGAGVRARAQRARAQGAGRAAAAAAGAGGAALPVQHAGQCAGAGRCRLAAGIGRAGEPDRLPARGGASPARAGDDARPGAAAGARLPGGDADAHAGSAAVRAADR